MQLGIFEIGGCMPDSRKLFFSKKSELENRIMRKAQGASFKKLATFVLSRMLMLFFLSLPAQALFAEGIVNQTTNRVTEGIPAKKLS